MSGGGRTLENPVYGAVRLKPACPPTTSRNELKEGTLFGSEVARNVMMAGVCWRGSTRADTAATSTTSDERRELAETIVVIIVVKG